MGQIGRFIDRCVEREPDLMRRVLDRPWGTLRAYMSRDDEGDWCGCLIGSIGIEAAAGAEIIDVVSLAARVAGCERDEAWRVGSGSPGDRSVIDLMHHLAGRPFRYANVVHGELRAVAMLKRRIARRLREQGIETRRPEVLMVRQRETVRA